MTVWELIRELTAEYVDPQSHVQISGEEHDLTENFTVTATSYKTGGQVVRIEAN